MTYPNVALETAVETLPFGWNSSFDWEVGGVKYTYVVRTSYLYYVGNLLHVYGDFNITKYRHCALWRWQYRRTVWSVASRSHVDLFDGREIENAIRPVAAKAGIIPSELLLERCIEKAQGPIAPIRDAALRAQQQAKVMRDMRVA